jgi:SRSO17 transposase
MPGFSHSLERILLESHGGDKEPTRYWLSTLPEDTPIDVLVNSAKLRWRIERDYAELKRELGLAHFEGRSAARLPSSRNPVGAEYVSR